MELQYVHSLACLCSVLHTETQKDHFSLIIAALNVVNVVASEAVG